MGKGVALSRSTRVPVRVTSQRSVSSKRWLERQLNDPYVSRARAAGLRSRAAFKLAEIDDKHRLLRKGARVLDLGAAPGGWSQLAAERVGAASGQGSVVAVDILPLIPIAGVVAGMSTVGTDTDPARSTLPVTVSRLPAPIGT